MQIFIYIYIYSLRHSIKRIKHKRCLLMDMKEKKKHMWRLKKKKTRMKLQRKEKTKSWNSLLVCKHWRKRLEHMAG